MSIRHRGGCDGWPGANPDGTVTCACGSRAWRPETLLKTVRRATRATTRRRLAQDVRDRLKAFWYNLNH